MSQFKLSLLPEDYFPAGSEHFYTLESGHDAGKQFFYYDFSINVAVGEIAENVVLFVHGNPESSYTYSQVRDEVVKLSDKPCRIIAMDHIGFGLSDDAHFEMIDFHHSANVKQLIAHLDLRNITLVIHDWGGAIGIGSVIDTPERVKNIVLMNTTVFPVPMEGKNYTSFPLRYFNWHALGYLPWRVWRHMPSLVLFSKVGAVNLFKRMGSYALRLISGRLSDDEKLYLQMFKKKENIVSARRNVRQTKFWGHGYCYYDSILGWQDNRAFYENIQSKIGHVWKDIAVKAYFGEYDALAQPSVYKQWLEAFPQLEGHMQTFPDAGHFVEESKYQEIACGILEVAQLQ